MNDGSKASTIAPAPEGGHRTRDIPKPDAAEFKVVEVREDGSVAVQLDDGRMVSATVAEGVEARKGAKVSITSEGEDKSGAPTGVVVTKVL